MVVEDECAFILDKEVIVESDPMFEKQRSVFIDCLKKGTKLEHRYGERPFDRLKDRHGLEEHSFVHPYESIASGDLRSIGFAENVSLRGCDRSINNERRLIALRRVISSEKNDFQHDVYEIRMYEDSVIMLAQSPEAIAKATSTFLQMLPNEFHSEKRDSWRLPLKQIKDHADFKHRGMLLDVCRHFFTVEEVKAYLEYMHRYKFNVLHWHLTEDQGWRVEIDAYPKLTEHAAWRIDPDGSRYGGFYTKDQIKEVVAYAEALGITVIPEIEMPGHSQAAISAHPYLSCQQKPVPVINDWGVFKEVYCAGNDSTFLFIETVLDEVMELFPSEYIHIGGDEAPKSRWEKCPKCQKRMATLGLVSEDELQGYFIKRIENYLNSKGRKLIGWDEILEGGVSKTATIQSWRGFEGGIEAAEAGQDVIMSPTSHCYFDYPIDNTDVPEVFTFQPIPTDLSADHHHHILGAECNLWSEHIPNKAQLDRMAFPRMIAMAEVLWSQPENPEKDYEAFEKRLQSHYPVLNALGINYGWDQSPLSVNPIATNEGVSWELKSGVKGAEVLSRWAPERDFETVADQRIELDGSDSLFVLVKMEDGREESFGFLSTSHIAHGASLEYETPYSHWYTAGGDLGLVDGMKGSLNFRDGHWQGAQTDLSVILDLGSVQELSAFETTFYQYINAWIMSPKSVQISATQDVNYLGFEEIGFEEIQHADSLRGQQLVPVSIPLTGKYRYLKIEVKNYGKLPDWHEAAGSDAWIFIDEIAIR